MLNKDVKILLVAGGKGGVGKSSISAGLASAFSMDGHSVGLLDADITGPSQSTLFPFDNVRAVGTSIEIPIFNGVAICSMGYFSERDSALVWSEETISSLFYSFLCEADWPKAELLIVDLPPTSGEVARILLDFFDCTNTVFVTTGTALSAADLRRDIAYHRRLQSHPIGIIENMAYFQCNHCNEKIYFSDNTILKDVTDETGLPLLIQLPYDRSIVKGYQLRNIVKECWQLLV